MTLREATRAWLEQLVGERLAVDLGICAGDDQTAIYCRSDPRLQIRMPTWEWATGVAVHDHAQFDCEAEGLKSVLGGTIPAPGVAGLPSPVIERTESGYLVHYDVLGFICWMLSRAEEVGREDTDRHERFPATSSHAYRHGYLERPAVDEWFAILRQLAERLWPRLAFVDTSFRLKVSHDVDEPSRYAFRSIGQLGRSFVADIVKRRSLRLAATRLSVWLGSRDRLHAKDPYNTFDWIMQSSERRGLASAFYFICGRTERERDGLYEVEHSAIRDLMRQIHTRGHEVGLHPSYGTYQTPSAIMNEAKRLFRVCQEEGVAQRYWGGRMHYLRWKTPITAHAWEMAGLAYDCTLGYADRPGFRCGTCFEYSAFDAVQLRPLNLKIRPLIAMECTVIDDTYLGLGITCAARDKFVSLKGSCRTVGGTFTLLWHNSRLVTDRERELYEMVLDA